MSNDNEPPKEPVTKTQRAHDAERDMQRRTQKILPLFHQFLERLIAQIEHAQQQGEPVNVAIIAPSYRLWSDAAKKSLEEHYHQFVAPLTAKEREALADENPYAARDFSGELMHHNEFEAVREFLARVTPQKTVREGEEFYQALEMARIVGKEIDMTGVASFTARIIKSDSGPSGPGGL